MTISTEIANKIEQELQSCKVARLQIASLLAADSAQQAKIALLRAEKTLLNANISDLKTHQTTLEKQNKKLYKRNKWSKYLLTGAFILGFGLGSQ